MAYDPFSAFRNMTESQVDWRNLMTVVRWAPVRRLRLHAATPLADGVLRLGPNAFMLCADFDGNGCTSTDAPLAVSVLWAASQDAALCYVRKSVANFSTAGSDSRPPPELLPCRTAVAPTYQGIVEGLQRISRPYSEVDVYSMGTDGALVRRTIEAGRVEYCFNATKAGNSDLEIPFAVRLILPAGEDGSGETHTGQGGT